MKTLYLIGFMGAGKSAVSRYLASHYGLVHLEMDAQIERRAGKTISEIFKEDGEPVFRRMETEFLEGMNAAEDTVVSCGGGTPMREENVALMKASGTVILLSASPETILRRVKNSHARPLLEGHKDVDYIRELLAQRLPAYTAAADRIISVDERALDDICAEIMGR